MTNSTKILIASVIAALTAILTALGVYVSSNEVPNPQISPSPSPSASTPSPLPIPSPSPSVSPKPSPTPSATPMPSPVASVSPLPSPRPSPVVLPSPVPQAASVQVLDTFERPEFATATQWKPSLTRTILDGQVTSVVLKTGSPCALTGISGLNVLYPYATTRPSAPSYPLGTFYDAMKPIDSVNCVNAKYLQLDVTASVRVGDAQITVVKKTTKAPVVPVLPLEVDLNNWTLVSAYGGYTKSTGTDALQALKLLKDHRISPYKGQEVHSVASWQQYVLPFALGPVYIDNTNNSASMIGTPTQNDAWVYLVDEPLIGSTAQMSIDLANWIKNVPFAKPMMTTALRQRDYRQTVGGVTNPNFAKLVDWPADIKARVKIFVPVAEQFCQETWAGSKDFYPCASDYIAAGKEFGLYESNMSHGNEGGGASGAPDWVLDRSAVELYGAFGLGLKYSPKFLLYYNSIQGWGAQDVWTNPYVYGGNGDGLLLYPLVSSKVALPSMRLKVIREASQFADIVALAGLKADVSALFVSTTNWTRDLAKFEAIRQKGLSLLP